MHAACNFDSPAKVSALTHKEKSECLQDCLDLNPGCKLTMLDNGECEESKSYSGCNTQVCGWDWGDCGYCAPNCNKAFLEKGSSVCIKECNTSSCFFQNGICGSWCSEGCSKQMLQNDVCDQKCYNAECNYDNTSCDGQCYTWMLGDGTCQNQCNTAELNYDKWDCTCSPGCKPGWQSNEICEPECFTEACNYDNSLKCLDELEVCANSCVKKYNYNHCNLDCLSWLCDYDDNEKCDPKLKTHAFYSQMILKDTTANINIYEFCLKNASKDMIDGKTHYCTLSKLNDKLCHTECNTLECAYDLGDCSSNCHTDCQLCYEPQNSRKCLSCVEGKSLLYTSCYSICPYGFISLQMNSIQVCAPVSLLKFTREETVYYYVTQQADQPYELQTGSLSYPFTSITDAMANIRKEYIYIYLKNYDNSSHFLRPVNIDQFEAAVLISQDYRPLDFDGVVKVSQIYIKPYKCENGIDEMCYNGNAKIQWKGIKAVQIDVNAKLYIENVDLYGYNSITLDECPLSEYFQYCIYCQNLSFDYDNYVNFDDHGTEITWKYAEETDCQRYQDSTLFKISSQGHLNISNSKIYDWRAGFSSIILNQQGTVELNSVKFENIILTSARTSAVILSNDCLDSSYRCGEINMIGCEVSLLNNGYEYNNSKSFSGFVYARGMFKLKIDSSRFSYNMIYKGSSTYLDIPNIGILIYIDNFLKAEITDSIFMNNIAENLIYFKMRTSYEQEFDGSLADYHSNLSHIYIKGVTFSNNSGSLISGYFENELPNIYLNQIYSIENIYSGNLIFFTINSYKTVWQSDRRKVSIQNQVRTEYVLNKRTVSLNDITFYSSYTTKNLISIQNIGNLYMNSLHIEKSIQNKDLSYSYLNTLVYSKFKQLPESYINQDYMHQDLEYSYDIGNSCYLIGITGLVIQNIDLIDNYSKKAGVCIEVIEALSTVDISKVSIVNNTPNGEKAPIGLSLTDYISDISLREITATDNRNINLNSLGVIYIVANSVCINCRVEIKDSLFQHNSAGFGGAVFGIVNQLLIENVQFLSNSITSGYGGSIYLNTQGQSQNSIQILKCTFSDSQIISGKGGAIAIDNNQNTFIPLALHIQDSDFTSNISSQDSSILFISSSVKLTFDSLIKNCKFLKNKSSDKGNIYLQYYSGVLTFENCRFEDNEGKLGIGIFYDIYQNNEDSSSQMCKLSLKSCSFQNNSSSDSNGTVLHKPDSGIYSTLETSSCIFQENKATEMYLEYGQWIDQGSVFQKNIAHLYGLISITNNAYALIKSATIQENISINTSGVIKLSSSGKLSLIQSTIRLNSSSLNGGVIFMEQNSLIMIESSSIFQNSANMKGSVIYSTGCNRSGSYISSSKIYENDSKLGGSIYLLNSSINITSSEIYQNRDSTTSGGIILYLSVLNMNSTSIHDQSGHMGAGIYAMTDSYVGISYCHFKSLHANFTGGFLYSFSSDIEISESVIEDASALSGGAIFGSSESVIIVSDSCFNRSRSGETGAMIKAQGSEVKVTNCSFTDFDKNAIEGTDLRSLKVINSRFSNGTGELGGAISCDKCGKFEITNSSFEAVSASIGGAVYAKTNKDTEISASFEIKASQFIKNTAMIGGVIYVDNLNLTVTDSYFKENSAYSPSDEPDRYGEGGAISTQCSDMDYCTFYIHDNSFTRNHANRNGGVISWKHFMPSVISNLYTNNTAKYGDQFSSKPVSFKIQNEHDLVHNSTSNFKSTIELGSLEGIAPGQKSTIINIALLDIYDNIVTTDSTSIGELSAEDNNVIISGVSKVAAYEGVFTFDDYTISSQPESSVKIYFSTNAIDESNFKARDILLLNLGIININLRECVLGEKRTEDKCIKCPDNTYSIDYIGDECKECPKNAICYGEFYLVPKSGYWKASTRSDKIFRCPKEDSCLGSPDFPNLVFTGNCESGYEGNLCQGCSPGYSRSSKNSCSKCPDSVYNPIKVILSGIGLIFVMLLIVRTTIKSAYKVQSIRSIYIKIFINYLQLISIVAGFNLEWPGLVLDFLSAQENVGNISEQILSMDCLLYDRGYHSSPEALYYLKLVLMFGLPFILVIVSAAFWGLLALIRKNSNYLKEELITTIVVLLFLVHPNVVNSMFYVFSCIEIEEDEYWLLNDMQIRCWNESHIYYALNIALPGILIWGIAAPAFCLTLLLKQRRKLKEISVRLKFGFLFNGYSDKYYYWEFIILYRKLLVICLAVFLGNLSVPIQALTAVTVLLLALYLQSIHNPYKDPELNEMELRSILVTVITIYCGLFYISGDINEVGKIVFFCVILLFNAYFLILWGKKLARVSLKYFSKRLPFMRNTVRGKETADYDMDEAFSFLSKKYSNRTMLNKTDPSLNYSECVVSNEGDTYNIDINAFYSMKNFYISILNKKMIEMEFQKINREAMYLINE